MWTRKRGRRGGGGGGGGGVVVAAAAVVIVLVVVVVVVVIVVRSSSSSRSSSGGAIQGGVYSGWRVEAAVMCARCAHTHRPRAATQFCGARENSDPGVPDARRSAAIDSGGGGGGGSGGASVGGGWISVARTACGVGFYTLYCMARGMSIASGVIVPGCCGSCAVSARRHRQNR